MAIIRSQKPLPGRRADGWLPSLGELSIEPPKCVDTRTLAARIWRNFGVFWRHQQDQNSNSLEPCMRGVILASYSLIIPPIFSSLKRYVPT